MKFFPDPLRQADIKFIFAKRLSYITRLIIIMSCVFTGVLLQLLLNFWVGFAFLILGTVLGLIKGYGDRPEFKGEEDWNQVTPDEYKKIKLRQKQLKRWDIDFFDITNPLGGFMFAVTGLFCFLVWVVLLDKDSQLAFYWAWDCVVVLIPHWLTGTRYFLKQDRLIIKINLLEDIMSMLSTPSDIQVLPMLSTRESKQGGRVPVDARLMLRFVDAPQYFLGTQVQISVNNVQGTDYPYLYSVIITKKGTDVFEEKKKLIGNPPHNLVVEETESGDANVLVIRQRTTKTSGYCTNNPASRYIVSTAVELTRNLISSG